MGFLSSLFGGGPKTTVVQSRIPEELAPYVKQILGEQQALYETRLGETPEEYQYQGQTIADLAEAQQEAREGIRGLVSGPSDYRDRSQDAFRRAYEGLVGVGEKFTDDQVGFEGTPTQFTGTQFEEKPLEEYMSPFQRAVTDVQKRKASEDFFERVLPQLRSGQRGRGRGSALGSRGAIVEAQLRDKFGRQLGDIEAIGLEKAYQDAQRRKAEDFERFKDQRSFEERGRKFLQSERDRRSDLFERQKKREAQVAEGLAGFAPREFQQRLREFGALERIGAEDQALEQKALNRAYADYLERRERPETLLARYTSGVYGNPMLRVPSRTETKPGVGLGQQLLGFGTALLGAPSGSIFGSMLGMGATGGGIGSLVNRRMGGGLSSLNPTVIDPMGEIIRRSQSGVIMNDPAGAFVRRRREQQERARRAARETQLDEQFKEQDDFLSAAPINERQRAIDASKKVLEEFDKRRSSSDDTSLSKMLSSLNPLRISSASAQQASPPQANQPSSTTSAGVRAAQQQANQNQNQNKKPSSVSQTVVSGSPLDKKVADALKLGDIDIFKGVNTADMTTIKTILTDTQKRNEAIKKQAEDLLSTKTPDAVKNRFGEIKNQTEAFFTDLQKTQDKNLQTFLSKIEKLNTPTDLPGMLFYIGVAGASDPDGFFSGATKGLKKWSDANIKDKKERKQFERDLAKYEFQASKDILATVKEGKLAGLNLSKEEQEAISKLPKEKLAILQILSQSQAGVDKIKLEIAKIAGKSKPLKLGKGQGLDKIKEQILSQPTIKKIIGADYKNTLAKDPRFDQFFDQLSKIAQKNAAKLAVQRGLKEITSGMTNILEGDSIELLAQNPQVVKIVQNRIREILGK